MYTKTTKINENKLKVKVIQRKPTKEKAGPEKPPKYGVTTLTYITKSKMNKINGSRRNNITIVTINSKVTSIREICIQFLIFQD